MFFVINTFLVVIFSICVTISQYLGWHAAYFCRLQTFFAVEEWVLFLLQKLSDTKTENSHPIGHWNDHGYPPQTKSQSDGIMMGNESNSSSRLVLNKDFMESQNINGAVKMTPSGQTAKNNGVMMSHFTSAYATSFSPSRYFWSSI